MEIEATATQRLYEKAELLIPGGTQLFAKRPQKMAPGQWPAYFSKACGCEVWDIDGRHYYDMSTNSVGACVLGYRDPDVTRAVQQCIDHGSMCSLNPPEEVELAELLCDIHPWAENVRFARTGGEAAAIAVRIARATTDRSVVAICGYHGWSDWYLAANLGDSDALRGHLMPGLSPIGVPSELRGTAIPFRYNHREEFQAVIDKYGDRLAAVIMESCRSCDPEPGFLEFVRDAAHGCGALLIYDEITVGWRLHFGGAHLKLGVNPDIAVFAKALGNGHPIAAIIGTSEAMMGAHISFISSTYWTESVGPTAALTTLKKMRGLDVPSRLAHTGSLVIESWKRNSAKHCLPVTITEAYPCLAGFTFEHELAEELRTLYTQLMLERGFLAGSQFYATMAHTEDIVAQHDAAVGEAFSEIADALESGDVRERLNGPVAQSGFKRLI